MKKGQKNKLYRWMDNQILASRIMSKSLYSDKPYYVAVCGNSDERKIHIYGIENLCRELNISYKVSEWDDEYEEHYFIYKNYRFFGLSKKRVNYFY